jgi:hypothetical protein
MFDDDGDKLFTRNRSSSPEPGIEFSNDSSESSVGKAGIDETGCDVSDEVKGAVGAKSDWDWSSSFSCLMSKLPVAEDESGKPAKYTDH